MALLSAIGQHARTENGGTGTFRSAYAVVRDAVGLVVAKSRSQKTAGSIIFLAIDKRELISTSTEIVKFRRQVDSVTPHIEVHSVLIGRTHDALAMIGGFPYRSVEIIGGVEHAKSTI